ncbi:hypothetical protein GNI_172570 [Gregarina niphandrodes]|uniref:Uncharacterized protein n=1 Tax=Gregarina niphandrodes TaxID=110365 RepID=A0A023AXS6_GRENI|nr:hypothetical protein GNI_172570 [Gregarina niphandrodes]EZG43429.1 hypothetical protein GNI_172570 [Gregarina niphandrodes]|eukprot:XP_011133340.1 hypothetical protein GNI_172570 [Gregarina niphandrodes]
MSAKDIMRSDEEGFLRLIADCNPLLYCNLESKVVCEAVIPTGSRDRLIGLEGWALDVIRNKWQHMVPPQVLREAGGSNATVESLVNAAERYPASILCPSLIYDNLLTGSLPMDSLPVSTESLQTLKARQQSESPMEFNSRSLDVEIMRRLPLSGKSLTNSTFAQLSESIRSSLNSQLANPATPFSGERVSLSRYAFDRLLYETICEHCRGLAEEATDPALPDPALPDPALPDPALPDPALPDGLVPLVYLRWAYDAMVGGWLASRLSRVCHGEVVAACPALGNGAAESQLLAAERKRSAYALAKTMARDYGRAVRSKQKGPRLPCYSKYLHGTLNQRLVSLAEWGQEPEPVKYVSDSLIDQTLAAYGAALSKVLDRPYVCQEYTVDQLVEMVNTHVETTRRLGHPSLSDNQRQALAHILTTLIAQPDCKLAITTRLNAGPGLFPVRLNLQPCLVPSLRVQDFATIPSRRDTPNHSNATLRAL